MDSEQQSAGFSISNLLGFDRAKVERSETTDKRHQQNLSENTGERKLSISLSIHCRQAVNFPSHGTVSSALFMGHFFYFSLMFL